MSEAQKRETAPDKAPDKLSHTGMSRREFARRAALASAAASLAPVHAATASMQASAPSAAAPQTPASANLPKLSPESQAEVDARVQAILAQYGSRLSDDQQSDIRRLCTLAQPPLDRMRAYHLDNADGPALYLKPLVEREKKPPAPKPAPAPKSTAAAKTPSAPPALASKPPSTPAPKKNP